MRQPMCYPNWLILRSERSHSLIDAFALLSDARYRFGIDLGKRLEYLSLASSHARSQLPLADAQQNVQELLKDADDKLEVAQIQVEIMRDVIGSTEIDDDDKETLKGQLDARLYTATEVGRLYAKRCYSRAHLCKYSCLLNSRSPAGSSRSCFSFSMYLTIETRPWCWTYGSIFSRRVSIRSLHRVSRVFLIIGIQSALRVRLKLTLTIWLRR